MDEPTIVNNVDRIDHLYSLVHQELKDLGIKLPKIKKLMKLNGSRNSQTQDDVFTGSLFGKALSQVPSTFLPDYGYVPKFLIEVAKMIDQHLETEGIFRKSGSLARQKELQVNIEAGKPMEGANIYDVASLMKQFFRELPEPIFASVCNESFVKCFNLPADKDPKRALFQMCLLLPLENIGTLRFTFHLLHRVASSCDKNKMTCNNLAVVMAPNLMHLNKGTEKMIPGEEKLLHVHTCIIELLIKNWEQVGMVDSALRQQLSLMSEVFGTANDDVEATDNNTLEESKDVLRRKKRKRSGSLTGFVSSIAHGIAKLRRSTDGRSINMSSNSTMLGELSLASNVSADCTQMSVSGITPCVMRKRQACEDSAAFSATKKKTILDNLPQRSALASTPFTPASTMKQKKSQRKSASKVVSLNSTTPASVLKTSRKKLTMFSSPGKGERPHSAFGRIESPSPVGKSARGRNFFRRLSGNRSGKPTAKDTLSKSLFTDQSREQLTNECHTQSDMMQETRNSLVRSLSSPALHDPESSFVVVDDQVPYGDDYMDQASALIDAISRQQYSDDVSASEFQSQKPDLMNNRHARRVRRSNSEGSPRGKKDVLNMSNNDQEGRNVVLQHKLEVCPASVISADKQVKCIRRDQAEAEKLGITTCKHEDVEKSDTEVSTSYQSDSETESGQVKKQDICLMETILPPPLGFDDQSTEDCLIESDLKSTSDGNEEIDVGLDCISVSGFSTISGGTVFHRPESRWAIRSVSNTSIGSCPSVFKSPTEPKVLQSAVSTDSLLSSVSRLSSHSTASTPSLTRSVSSDSGRGSLVDEVTCDKLSDNMRKNSNCRTRSPENEGQSLTEADEVILRHPKDRSFDRGVIRSYEGNVCNSRQSFSQVEADRSSSKTEEVKSTCSSHEFKRSINMHSVSSDNLSLKPVSSLNQLVRSSSLHKSPGKKFNYKPHLEITRETHNLLARAGYVKPADETCNSRYVQVDVKSPKRSSHREEMMLALRSSFHERHSGVNLSIRSSVNRFKVATEHTETSIKENEKYSVHDESDITAKEKVPMHESDITANEKVPMHDFDTTAIEKVAIHDFDITANEKVPLHESDITTNENKPMYESESDVVDVSVASTMNEINKSKPLTEIKASALFNMGTNSTGNENLQNHTETTANPGPVDENNSSVEDFNNEIRTPEKRKDFESMKKTDKSLTLSGILDKEIARQVKIKRAAVKFPKHESIVNIQQAGLVSQNAFSKIHHNGSSHNFAMPPVTKRGNSPVRIPTVFAKGLDKVEHSRQISQFVRESKSSKSSALSTSNGQDVKSDNEQA